MSGLTLGPPVVYLPQLLSLTDYHANLGSKQVSVALPTARTLAVGKLSI